MKKWLKVLWNWSPALVCVGMALILLSAEKEILPGYIKDVLIFVLVGFAWTCLLLQERHLEKYHPDKENKQEGEK